MRELFRHIGPETDCLPETSRVGGREIGYMYGYYKKYRIPTQVFSREGA
jgi:glutamate dehydrogenase (NADP+)